MKMTFDEVLAFCYEHLDEFFRVAEIILFTLINRNVSKTVKAAAPASAPAVIEEAAPAPTAKEKNAERKAALKNLRATFENDLALLFSDKPDEELTEDESQRLALLLEYVQGGQNGK